VKPHSVSFNVLLGAALFAFIESFSLLSPILFSLLLILLISMALNPLISRMRALTGGRKVATGLVAAAFVVVIGLTAWAFVGPLETSTAKIGAKLPGYWERLQKPLIKMEQQEVHTEEKLQAEVTTEIAQNAKTAGEHQVARRTPAPPPAEAVKEPMSLRSALTQMLQGVVGGFKSMAFSASQIMVVFITVFFGVAFTLMNPGPIFGAIFSLVPERHHQQTLTILQRIGKFVPTWALATLLAMLTVGFLVFLLMWPFFGFLDALVLGLIAGIFEAIPYLGPFLSAVPAFLFALGEGGMTPVWVLLVYLAVQLLENNVISPLIMARSMKLHPVAVIFSMLLCMVVFGVLGVLVAAPMVAIVDILQDELYRKRFLPTVTDADLHRLAQSALCETKLGSKRSEQAAITPLESPSALPY
jgi:predicted PurR-regulated permease PerM